MRIRRLLCIVLVMIFSFSIMVFAEERRPLGESGTRPRWTALNEDYLPIKNEWHLLYNGAWVYLDAEGYALQNTWFQDPDSEKWYYFDEYCYMLHDTTTPDGYKVGADGAWIEE